ncbi:efflux RND transporter periplasmic adaptor subunit [Candidatus Thiothrix sp. Deng01]|uniref:Efflux RND transporter periplasmic adaptor subunit n=1 Tax=Candidatus Thiothrix phosphatis TaxID=3112415 RepID=A0ABU6D1E9_9GAMM|nr:efflux RND transporter periplasmic adaptor subunit [Candidatus Thiothrix sp. Deng01]MEB4592671.1 efflux RND transporter periplasmic adaptor subunit [Candidatus Thiothrix sp. Deng01]
MKILQQWVLIVGLSTLVACGGSEQAGQPASGQQVKSGLQTTKASAIGMPEMHYLDGHVEAVNQSTISAQTSGVIEQLFYDVDDYVEKGKVIARIKSKSQQAGVQQAQAALDEADARYKEAEAEFKRISDIYARKLVPKADFDSAQASLKAAEARLDAAKAQVTQAGEQLGYTSLIAPYGGIVTKRHVELGEAVNPGTPIMTGISLDQLRVVVEVPQRLIAQVRQEKKAFVFQDGSNKSLPVKDLTFFPYADPKTNAFKVRIDLADGAKDLFPGMFVKVAFVIGQQDGVVSVPESAVVVRSEVIGVYVINANGQPSLRQVRLGRKLDDKDISVLAGLDAGETIALDPVQAAIFLKQQTAEAKHDE